MNYIKILGHSEDESEVIINSCKRVLGSSYMGFSRKPPLSDGSGEVHFPISYNDGKSFGGRILDTLEQKINDSDSLIKKKNIQISIEAE